MVLLKSVLWVRPSSDFHTLTYYILLPSWEVEGCVTDRSVHVGNPRHREAKHLAQSYSARQWEVGLNPGCLAPLCSCRLQLPQQLEEYFKTAGGRKPFPGLPSFPCSGVWQVAVCVYVFVMYIWVFCFHVCLFATCVPGILGGQKRVCEPLELELTEGCELPCG